MNIYYNTTLSQYELYLSNAGVDGGNFVLTAETASVPEPSTWAMMLIGMGAVGGALRAKRRRALRIVT